mgnify:CR=1 FL=1
MAFTIMRSGVFTILAGKTLAGPRVSKGEADGDGGRAAHEEAAARGGGLHPAAPGLRKNG